MKRQRRRFASRRRVGDGWRPPPPLILAAWWGTPALQSTFVFWSIGNRRTLTELLEWAQLHGWVPRLETCLRSLPESDWYHFGDLSWRAKLTYSFIRHSRSSVYSFGPIPV